MNTMNLPIQTKSEYNLTISDLIQFKDSLEIMNI